MISFHAPAFRRTLSFHACFQAIFLLAWMLSFTGWATPARAVEIEGFSMVTADTFVYDGQRITQSLSATVVYGQISFAHTSDAGRSIQHSQVELTQEQADELARLFAAIDWDAVGQNTNGTPEVIQQPTFGRLGVGRGEQPALTQQRFLGVSQRTEDAAFYEAWSYLLGLYEGEFPTGGQAVADNERDAEDPRDAETPSDAASSEASASEVSGDTDSQNADRNHAEPGDDEQPLHRGDTVQVSLQLSAGQRQRVTVARAIADQPAVLLLDQASHALEPEQVDAMLELVDAMEDGPEFQSFTHNLETLGLGDYQQAVLVVQRGALQRVTLIQNGGNQLQGTRLELLMWLLTLMQMTDDSAEALVINTIQIIRTQNNQPTGMYEIGANNRYSAMTFNGNRPEQTMGNDPVVGELLEEAGTLDWDVTMDPQQQAAAAQGGSMMVVQTQTSQGARNLITDLEASTLPPAMQAYLNKMMQELDALAAE